MNRGRNRVPVVVGVGLSAVVVNGTDEVFVVLGLAFGTAEEGGHEWREELVGGGRECGTACVLGLLCWVRRAWGTWKRGKD